jgi:hypothetical protein
MDAFVYELLNLGAIVRTIILGIVMIFITKTVNRYLSYRSVKSIQRRIRYAEAEKSTLDNLATSDRSLLLFSFRFIFGILSLVSTAFIAPVLLAFVQGDPDPRQLFIILIWFVVGITAGYAANTLKKLDGSPASIESINQKIDSLKMRLSKLIDS